MATTQPADKWEEMGHKVNEAQLKPLETIADTAPEKVLEAARGIGVISEDTEKRIIATMGADLHVALFKRALNEEKKNLGEANSENTRRAFIRAFEHTYGRFMLEQTSGKYEHKKEDGTVVEMDLDHKDSIVMQKLDKVLKFRVTDEHGLKGRPELQAAVRRLREVAVSKGHNQKVTAELAALSQKNDEHAAKKADLEPKRDVLQKALAGASALGLDIDLSELEDRVDFLEKDKARLDEEVSRPRLTSERNEYLSKITELSGELLTFREAIVAYGFDFKKNDEILDLLKDLKTLTDSAKFNDKNWRSFLEKRIKPFLKRIQSSSYIKSEKAYPNSTKLKSVNLGKNIENIGQIVGYLETKMQKFAAYSEKKGEQADNPRQIAEFQEGKTENDIKRAEIADEMVAKLDAIKPQVDKLNNKELDDLVPGISKRCLSYLKNFETLKSSGTDIREFIESEYKPFIADITRMIKEKATATAGELSEANQFLDVFEGEKKRLESLKSSSFSLQDILDRAFGTEMQARDLEDLKRKSHHAAEKKDSLREIYNLMDGKAIDETNSKFKKLNGSDAAAKNLRINEARLKEYQDQRKPYENIRDKFGADQAVILDGKFQELEAFNTQHPDAIKTTNVDAELAEQRTEADVLKSQIAAYQAVNAKTQGKETAADVANQRNNLEKIGPLTNQLKAASKKIAELEAIDKFRKTASSLRGELISFCNGYLNAKEPELKTLEKNVVEDTLASLLQLNVNASFKFSDLSDAYTKLRAGFKATHDEVKSALANQEEETKLKQSIETDKSKLEKGKDFYDSIKPIVEGLLKAAKQGVVFRDAVPSSEAVAASGTEAAKPAVKAMSAKEATDAFAAEMEKDFIALKLHGHSEFDVTKLTAFYGKYLEPLIGEKTAKAKLITNIVEGLVQAEKDAKTADKALAIAKEGEGKSKDLSDATAARRIIGVLVADKYKDMSPADREKIVKMMLAGDVGRLMTEEGYADIARKGSAEKLELVDMTLLRSRLLDFEYEEDGKAVRPFEGFKPDDFKDLNSIKNLFTVGKLDYKNGVYLLAALERFDKEKNAGSTEADKIISIQVSGLRKLVIESMAKSHGVSGRMDEAGVSAVIEEQFKETMLGARSRIDKHFDDFDKDWGKDNGLRQSRIAKLEEEWKQALDDFRDGKINSDLLKMEKEKLLKSAEQLDVLQDISFSQSTVASMFWNHRYSQKVRDKGISISKFLGAKLGMGMWGLTKGGLHAGARGVGKIGLRTGSAVMGGAKHVGSWGIGAAKYGAWALTGIGSAFVSIFRKGKWTDTIKNDVKGVYNKFEGWQKGLKDGVSGMQKKVVDTSKGMKVLSHIGHHTAAEFAKPKYKDVSYAEKEGVKKERAMRLKRLEELKGKTKLKHQTYHGSIHEAPSRQAAEKLKMLEKMQGSKDAATPAASSASGGATH